MLSLAFTPAADAPAPLCSSWTPGSRQRHFSSLHPLLGLLSRPDLSPSLHPPAAPMPAPSSLAWDPSAASQLSRCFPLPSSLPCPVPALSPCTVTRSLLWLKTPGCIRWSTWDDRADADLWSLGSLPCGALSLPSTDHQVLPQDITVGPLFGVMETPEEPGQYTHGRWVPVGQAGSRGAATTPSPGAALCQEPCRVQSSLTSPSLGLALRDTPGS